MNIDLDFILYVALICVCCLLVVLFTALICFVIDNAIKKHKQRVAQLKELEEKTSRLETESKWLRLDVNETMLNVHNLENTMCEKEKENEKNNRKNSYK